MHTPVRELFDLRFQLSCLLPRSIVILGIWLFFTRIDYTIPFLTFASRRVQLLFQRLYLGKVLSVVLQERVSSGFFIHDSLAMGFDLLLELVNLAIQPLHFLVVQCART